MSIANVALSNTFNEFRLTTNEVIAQVNDLSGSSGVSAGTYGSATQIPQIVISSSGRLTSASNVAISTDLSISGNTGTDTITLGTDTLTFRGTGGITGAVTANTVTMTLGTTGVSAATYGSSSQVPQLVIDAQGRVTSASNVSVAGVSAFNYHSGNANFEILTSAGGSLTATIGQDLGTTSNPTFNNVIVSGNLTVSGTSTTVNTETILLADNKIVLNSNLPGGSAPSEDVGIIVNRGSSSNVEFIWDEGNDRWTFGSQTVVAGTFSGSGASLTSIPNSATTASAANGASTIVARDASGNTVLNRLGLGGVTNPAYALDVSNTSYLSFSGVPTLRSEIGGAASRHLVSFPANPNSNEPTNTIFTTGSSESTLKLAAGVNVIGGQIDLSGGSAGNNAGGIIFRAGTGGGAGYQSIRMIITGAGLIGIGNTSPDSTYALSITGNTYVSSQVTATDFNSLSDATMKININPVTNALDVLDSISGFEFDWASDGRKSSGVLAQDIEKVLPHLVNTSSSGIKTVNYQGLSAYLIQGFKELYGIVKSLKDKNGV